MWLLVGIGVLALCAVSFLAGVYTAIWLIVFFCTRAL